MTERISGFQLMTIMFWQVSATGILSLPPTITYFAPMSDSWIVTSLLSIATTGMAGLAAYFTRTFSQSYTSSLVTAFGRWIGHPIQWFVVAFYYLCACTVLREVTLFVETNFLRHTPVYVIMALFILPTAYLVSCGLETLARLSQLITPIAIGVTIFLFAMSMKEAEFRYLQPVLADGWVPIFRALICPLAFVCEFGIAFEFLQSVKSPKNAGRWMFLAGVLVAATGAASSLVTALVAGPISTFITYPIFLVVRSITIGEFVQRLDAWYVIVIVIVVMIKLGTFYYCLCQSMARTFSLGSYQTIVWPALLPIWAGSYFFFQSATTVTSFIEFTFPSMAFIVWAILPVVVCAVYRIRCISTRTKMIKPT